MLHLYIPVSAEQVLERRDEIAARDGVWVIGRARPAEVPGWCVAEIYVGDNLLGQDDASVVAWLGQLVG